jgi:tetratricopeptide (TPR) repeat protein
MGKNKRAAELLAEYLSLDSSGVARAGVCYDLGEIQISLKEYEKALGNYYCCFNVNPWGRLAENSYLRKGDCYFFMKHYEEAEKEYGNFPRMFPESQLSGVAQYRRGLSLSRMGKTERADSIFQGLLDMDNIDRNLRVKLLKKMGQSYYSETQFTKAKGIYTELASLEKTAANLTLLAEILETTGDTKEAEEFFSSALTIEDVDTCRVLKGRAKVRYRLGKYGGGEKDLERLWGLCPDSDAVASVLLEKGMIFINNKEYKKARETLNYITNRIKGTECAKKAIYYQALCDIEGGGYKEAEKKLNLFLAGSPHSPIACMAYFKLALAELNMEKLNLAARNFSLASEACSDPGLSLEAFKNLARIYQKMEDWEKASSTWEQIIEKYPADTDIVESLFKLGFSYSQSGRYRLAHGVYSRIPAIAVNEKQLGRAHYWAGISLKNISKYREAIREFLRVPYLRTGGMWGVTAKLEAAGCYSKLERYDEAAGIYENVISSHGKDSDWGKIAAGSLKQIRNKSDEKQNEKN